MPRRNRQYTGIIVLAIFLTLMLDGEAWAQEVAGGIMDDFISQTNRWWGILREKALGIFKIVLVIDVCLFGFRIAMSDSNVGDIFKEFVTLLVFAGFIALVIVNYENWSKAVAINGLTSIIGDLTTENFSVDRPFTLARTLWGKTAEVSTSVEITQLPRVMLYMVAVGFLVIALFFLSALMILVKCEFYIVANIGVLLIGLGGSKIFKEYATNVMRYVLSIGVKIFVIQLLANIGLAMISMQSISSSMTQTGTSVTIDWATVFVLVAKTLILIVLAKTLPDSCAGMINGATVGGGNPMAAMAQGVGAVVGAKVLGGAIAAGKAGAGVASTAKGAFDAAKAQGASGVGGTLRGMKQSFSEAREAAKTARKDAKDMQAVNTPGSIRSQLRSQFNAATAQQEAMRQAASAPAAPEVPEPEPAPTPPLENAAADNAPAEEPYWKRYPYGFKQPHEG